MIGCLSIVLLLSGCQSSAEAQPSADAKNTEQTVQVSKEDLAELISILDNGDFAINGKDTRVKAQGEKGADGKDGADGLQEIIDVIGKNGTDGAQGEQGEQGAQSEQGEQGAQGKQGEQGA